MNKQEWAAFCRSCRGFEEWEPTGHRCRCKRCGGQTTVGRCFCSEECEAEYPTLDIMERAQRACMGSPTHETHRIYSTEKTWKALLAYKDELIEQGDLNPINAGIWHSFWGYNWCPDPNMAEGDFAVRKWK